MKQSNTTYHYSIIVTYSFICDMQSHLCVTTDPFIVCVTGVDKAEQHYLLVQHLCDARPAQGQSVRAHRAQWKSVLQCVAVCCSVLQCTAMCYSVLQCVAVWWKCVAVCCSAWAE